MFTCVSQYFPYHFLHLQQNSLAGWLWSNYRYVFYQHGTDVQRLAVIGPERSLLLPTSPANSCWTTATVSES